MGCYAKAVIVALVSCAECGAKVSDQAKACPSCGHPTRRPRGVDEGFELSYAALSYRRKFYRTLWLLPLTPIALFVNWLGLPGIFWFVVALAVFVAQAAHNYTKWKSEE